MTPEEVQALRKPFDPAVMGKLPKPTKKDNAKGNCNICKGYHGLPAVHLDYVGHASVTDRLLTVDPDWTWEPMVRDPDTGEPRLTNNGTGLWINLTVLGVTRPGYGDVEASKAWNAKELISDALRNAAMRFGVALELWQKGELESAHLEEQPPGFECGWCSHVARSKEDLKPHLVSEHGWMWGTGDDAKKVFPPAHDETPAVAAEPAPVTPTPEPAPTPATAVPAPADEPVATIPDEPEFDVDGPGDDDPDEDEISYEDFEAMSADEVKALAKEYNVKGQRGKSIKPAVWMALVEAGIGAQYECNVEDCNAFRFNTEAEAIEHYDTAHGDAAEPDETPVAAPESPATPEAPSGTESDDSGPAPEASLTVIRAELSRLSGGAAREYANYRRQHGISSVENLTFNQACDLVDFLDRLPH